MCKEVHLAWNNQQEDSCSASAYLFSVVAFKFIVKYFICVRELISYHREHRYSQ